MRNLKTIMEHIKRYYPNITEYNAEKQLHNNSLSELSEVCKFANANNQNWLNLLNVISRYFGSDAVIENTLLIYSEPSYSCFIKIVDDDLKVAGFKIYISVIVDFYFIYYHSFERKTKAFKNTVDLQEEEQLTSYHHIQELVQKYFPNHKLLAEELAYKEVGGIIIPSRYDDRTVRICDCIFTDKMQ